MTPVDHILPGWAVDPTAPVAALRRQFAERRGVRVAEVTTSAVNGEPVARVRTDTTVDFEKSGPVATRVSITANTSGASVRMEPETAWPLITDDAYYPGYTGNPGNPGYPAYPGPGAPRFAAATPTSAGPVHLLEPDTLRAVLLSAYTGRQPSEVLDGTPTTVMSGTISMGELGRISPGFRSTHARYDPDTAVSWRLWLGQDELPRRLTTTWTRLDNSRSRTTTINDSRFTEWGRRAERPTPESRRATAIDLGSVGVKLQGLPDFLSGLFR
ncbi:hypothetical protein C1I98_21450 [Spongiactinospora gelatinilytica]|uniref:Uncharacterized protein n=1 Tax=Spongiactinospora gelatinilytica TaxID=2666298 RepID=A0A2W2HRE6_9ACTN|nr:hypothetical protein [Spongiactinospora gelatinilytica]PZG41314.1 hypothetical protein C1I98_21450 [Spongiactinospora gelatinilytica]